MLSRLDRDTTEVIAMLREALTASELSQASFARAIGTSGPRLSTYLSGDTKPSAQFVVRARRLGRALGGAADRGLMSAPVTAAAMRTHLLAGDTAWVWRMLLQGRDHLAAIIEEGEQALLDSWEAQPGSVGSTEWDALLAAVVEHEFETAGLEAPAWTRLAPLAVPWMPDHPFLSAERVRAQTPDWLSSRNIYVPRRDLVTA
ncbi:helix-turn-helix transcriptional regulator [Nocardioides sp. YIM 152588]|uniref:helix-turn-helix domain-containing protein n=1 Tax=Nocardioides sp. YIM 152588 TaxID=3158259 RepID=UPI0032E44B79